MRNCGDFPLRDGETGRSPTGRADDRCARPSRSRRQRRLDRAGCGPRASPAVDHRPRRFAAADARRRWPRGDLLQWRDLQLPRIAPRARTGRGAVSHPWRYRSDPRRMAEMGPRLPRAARWHVRLRALRSRPAAAVPRTRPAGGETALPCAARGRGAGLRQRNEGAARQPPDAARGRSAGDRGLHDLGLCPRSPRNPQGRRKVARGSFPAARTWPRTGVATPMVGCRFRRAREGADPGPLGAIAPSHARRRDQPDGCRCTARGLPFGRGRQFLGRRTDERGERATGHQLFDRLRCRERRRDAPCAAGRRTVRHRPPRADRLVRPVRRDRPDCCDFRRAVRRCQRAAHLAGVRTRARAGHRGAVGRWRGRGFRRLSPPDVPCARGTGALGPAARLARTGVRRARAGLAQGRLGAAPAAREDDPAVVGRERRGGLCACVGNPRARAAAGALWRGPAEAAWHLSRRTAA